MSSGAVSSFGIQTDPVKAGPGGPARTTASAPPGLLPWTSDSTRKYRTVSCVRLNTGENEEMTEPLSIRLDVDIKKRLDALASGSKHSKSHLVAEAIAAYVQAEEWHLGEIQQGLADFDRGHTVSQEKVDKWLRSWGKPAEGKAPR
jgi:RHH-type transcriptional regulator, rel operon repressor / antitoxin RelB